MPLFDYLPGKGPIHGKRKGSLFSFSRFGSVARAGTIPERNPTNRREARKSALVIASSRWAVDLTPTEITGWNDLATATTFVNALGENYSPSGRNLFIRTNSLRLFYGLSLNFSAPGSAVSPFFEKEFYFDPETSRIAVSASSEIPSDTRCYFDFSVPLRRTVNFHQTPFVSNQSVLGAASAQGVTLANAGSFRSGDRVSIRSRDMGSDGALSAPEYYLVDLDEPQMFLIQSQMAAINLSVNQNFAFLNDGGVITWSSSAGNGPTYNLPVACRLRHLSLFVEVGDISGTPGTIALNVSKNGGTISTISLTGTDSANSRVNFVSNNIVGLNFAALDRVSLFINNALTSGQVVRISKLLCQAYYEIGVF